MRLVNLTRPPRHHPVARVLAGAAALLLAAAPAATPAAAQRLNCRAAKLPARLPIALELVDSMGLSAALRGAPAGAHTLSLRYAAEGMLTHALPLADSADAADSLAHAVSAAVARNAYPQDSAAAAWSLRLTVVTPGAGDSAGVRLAVERSVHCPARPAGPPVPRYGGLEVVSAQDAREIFRPNRVLVKVRVDHRGQNLGAELAERSGSRAFDEMVLRDAARLVFEPARWDGFRVAEVYEYRVETRVR